MPVLSGQTAFTGVAGITPNLVFIDTNDTVATVTTTGYLNHAVQEGLLTLQNGYMAIVNTQINQNHGTPKVPVWLAVSISGVAPNLTYSLVATENGGGAIFAGNVQAGLNGGPAGAFISYPATINTGFIEFYATSNAGNYDIQVTNSSFGQASSILIPDPGASIASFVLTQSAGTQQIGTGNIAILTGTLQVGSAGHLGTLTLFPAATGGANDKLVISPLTAGGNFTTTIRNSAMAQSSTISIPDPGAATAKFILDHSAGTQTIATGSLTLTAGSFTATAGNFIAGNSATPNAGNFQSFPAASGGANDKLVLAAVTTGGNFTTTISNGTQGQTSVVTIPDVGSATGRFLVGATATPFTANHSLVASGTGGLIADAGYQMKTVAQAAVAGGAAAQTVNDAFCTSASMVVACWNDTTNPVTIQTVAAGNGSFVVTSSGDPGASHISYIITKV